MEEPHELKAGSLCKHEKGELTTHGLRRRMWPCQQWFYFPFFVWCSIKNLIIYLVLVSYGLCWPCNNVNIYICVYHSPPESLLFPLPPLPHTPFYLYILSTWDKAWFPALLATPPLFTYGSIYMSSHVQLFYITAYSPPCSLCLLQFSRRNGGGMPCPPPGMSSQPRDQIRNIPALQWHLTIWAWEAICQCNFLKFIAPSPSSILHKWL